MSILDNKEKDENKSNGKQSKEHQEIERKPPTPGMKYKHYSPVHSQVILIEESKSQSEKVSQTISKLLKETKGNIALIRTHPSFNLSFDFIPFEIGVTSSNHQNESDQSKVSKQQQQQKIYCYDLGDGTKNPESVAQGLFGAFRELDNFVDFIVVEGISEAKEGLAVMNRARKAASQVI
jgi:L-threonylcarbamoyladenylate synthase